MKKKYVQKNVQTVEPVQKINYAPVGLLRVLLSMVYDGLLLVAMSIAWAAICVGLHVSLFGAPAEHHLIHWALWESFVYVLGLVVFLSAYYVYCWQKSGQTLGMKTWRLMVIDEQTQQKLSFRQSLHRVFFAIVSLAIFGFGFWLKLIHPQKKSLHDWLSKSQVILLKKN